MTESVQPAIKLNDLRVTYRTGDKPFDALTIPEWTLERGRLVALMGPSGCGKTTLLHVLSGLLSPSRGMVEVCGHRLDGMRESDLDRFRARHIGYIFQSFNLLQGYTALENVLLGISFSERNFGREHAVALLERVGLSERLNHYPSQLSIGEQQRVAVARSLANRPDVILADEPTGSLDPKNSHAVADLIRDVCSEEKCTLVLVSHEADIVSRFEETIPFLEINLAFAEAYR
jgi:putative ABC transport system ATP-binding protein